MSKGRTFLPVVRCLGEPVFEVLLLAGIKCPVHFPEQQTVCKVLASESPRAYSMKPALPSAPARSCSSAISFLVASCAFCSRNRDSDSCVLASCIILRTARQRKRVRTGHPW